MPDMPEAGSKPSDRVVLVSIDGWGIRKEKEGNAILNANTPNMDALEKEALFCQIDASGLCVGLPEGVMGNSEVGHLTMGAGRVEFQDLVRINKALQEKEFEKNETLKMAMSRAKEGTGRVHLLTLVSDGAVHSHINHLIETLRVMHLNKVPQVFVHFFADGRDTPPTTATKYIEQLRAAMASLQPNGYGSIASVTGRFYAMDRDKRWERILIAHDALTAGKGDKVEHVKPENLIQTIEKRYGEGENDEFLRPIIVDEDGLIRDGDSLIFLNFRSDRMREITSVFSCCTEKPVQGAPVACPISSSHLRKNLLVVQMTQYDEKVKLPTLFPPQSMTNGLPEWLSKHAETKQFHTAETEKYAHVTFFFAGGREVAWPNEDRGLIPSPKVATYDLAPAMSQEAVGSSVIDAMKKDEYAFILCNLAAPDMVGHTGVYDKAVEACQVCDAVIGRIRQACKQYNYSLVVTADHGNAEEMCQADGTPKTSHTTNLIPLIVDPSPKLKERGAQVQWIESVKSMEKDPVKPAGGLADVAPTVLTLMGLRVPKEMTGKPLVQIQQ